MVLKKRPFDNNSLHTSVKKQKLSQFSMSIMEESILGLRNAEEQKLHTLEKDIEECSKELLNKKKEASGVRRRNQYYKKMQNKIEECVEDLAAEEARVGLLEELIKKKMYELKKNKIKLRKVMDSNDKDGGGRKGEELETLSQKIAECTKEIKTKKEELGAAKISVSGKVEELRSERSKLLKVMSKRRTDECAQMKDFEPTKKEYEGRVTELDSEEKQCDLRLKELDSKEKLFEGRAKELESKQEEFEARVKEFESKEEEFKGQVKELESKKKHFESRVKELGSKAKLFERRVDDLDSFKKHFESQLKRLKSKENQFEGRVKEFELKERKFESRVREFESKEEEFKGRVREFEVKQLELQLNELKSQENQFEGQVRDLESMQNSFDAEYETLIKSFEEEIESDDQPSLTIDGRSFQLFPIEDIDGLESHGNEVLANLLASSSDPSKDVLDIIQNPIIPRCKGDNAAIIDDSHVDLLEQLMRISPHVKPRVREDAMNLALNLKAVIGENNENSVPVLGFLLLLSIYGLVSSFDEDEVLNLFGFVAQHKIAVELFGTMGLAHKISDFVQNLIRKQQHIEAVRFKCAYDVANKNQSVDLLRKHLQSAKVIYESKCKTTDSIEIKDKARDEEIASLGTVLRCISDYNIDSADLLKEIQGRILELKKERQVASGIGSLQMN